MSAVDNLLVRLIGDGSSYRLMLNKAIAQTKVFQTQIAAVSVRIKAMAVSMVAAGRRMTMGLTLPILAIGAASVKAFSDFNSEMTKSTSIMKVTTAETKQMKNLALSLSREVAQSPRALAQSYFFLASAGLDAQQSMAALPKVAAFATAGAFDMATATDLLTDAQSALGLASDDAATNMEQMVRVSDVLVKANTLANASVQQFSESLTNTAAATLKTYNKTVEEGVAVLAAYADQGVKGNVAGTNLTRITLLLSKSAQKQAKAHKELGFEVFNSSGKMNNYSNIIKQLERITRGMSDETKAATLTQLGFEARVQAAILPLIGASEKIAEYETALKKAGGTTKEVSDKQMESFKNKMVLVKNAINEVAIVLGEGLAPMMEGLADNIKTIATEMATWDKEQVALAIKIAGFVTAAGPLVLLVGSLVKNFIIVGGAMKLFGAALASGNPWAIALAAGIIVLGIAISMMMEDLDGSIETFHRFVDTLEFVKKKIAFLGAFNPLKSPRSTSGKEMMEQLGQRGPGMDLETFLEVKKLERAAKRQANAAPNESTDPGGRQRKLDSEERLRRNLEERFPQSRFGETNLTQSDNKQEALLDTISGTLEEMLAQGKKEPGAGTFTLLGIA